MSDPSKSSRILDMIDTLRGELPPEIMLAAGIENEEDSAHYIIKEIFTNGNCGNFAVALCIAFGGAPCLVSYVEDDPDLVCHAVAEIDGRLYDINGDVTERCRISERVTIEQLKNDEGFFGNYCFASRGPIV